MTRGAVDYVVVGASLAGVAAALRLAVLRRTVVLIDFDRDTDTIADLSYVSGTALAPEMTGVALEERLSEALTRANVQRQTNCHVTGIYSDGAVVVECSDRLWTCKGVVFAPNGTEPGIDIDGSSALQGFGVSYSAAADAPYYASSRVAVYGDSPRVLEHALLAARYVSDVVVLLKGGTHEADAQRLARLRSTVSTELFERSVLRSLHATSEPRLSAVEVGTPTGSRVIEVAALFVAQHVVPIVDVVRNGRESNGIAFAGLAAGIKYWQHASLVADGERAACSLIAGKH